MSTAQKKHDYRLLTLLIFICFLGLVVFSINTKNLIMVAESSARIISEIIPEKNEEVCINFNGVGYVPSGGTLAQRAEIGTEELFLKYPFNRDRIMVDTLEVQRLLEKKYSLSSEFLKATPQIKDVKTLGDAVVVNLYLTPNISLFIGNNFSVEFMECNANNLGKAIEKTILQIPTITKVQLTVEGEDFPCDAENNQRCKQLIYSLGVEDIYVETAGIDDSTSDLALRAADKYVKQASILSETTLSQRARNLLKDVLIETYGDASLVPGEQREFSRDLIEKFVKEGREQALEYATNTILRGVGLSRADSEQSGLFTSASVGMNPTEVWKFQISKGYFNRCFSSLNGVVFVDGQRTTGQPDFQNRHYIVGIDSKNGNKVFEYDLGSEGVKGCPAINNNLAIFQTDERYLKAINLATGKLTWELRVGKDTTSPNIFSENVFIGNESAVYSIDADGNTNWKLDIGGTVVGDLIIMQNGTLAFNNSDGNIYAVDSSTGKLIWKKALFSYDATTKPENNNILVITSNGTLKALNSNTGDLFWEFDKCSPLRNPAIGNDTIYLTCSMNAKSSSGFAGVVALDKSTGTEKWRFETGRFEGRSPIISGDAVYFMSQDGYLYSLKERNGKVQWSYPTSEMATSTMTVEDGKLLFISGNYIHALE